MSITVVTAYYPFSLTRLIKSLHKPDKVWLTSKLQDLYISIWTKLQINLYEYTSLNKRQLLINIQGHNSKAFVMQNLPKWSFSKKQFSKGLRACSSVEFIRALCTSTYDTSAYSQSRVKTHLQGFMVLKNFSSVRSYVLQDIIQQCRICKKHYKNAASTIKSYNEVTQSWNSMQALGASTCPHIIRCSYSNSLQAMCASIPSNATKYSFLNPVQGFCTSTCPHIVRCSYSNSLQAMCTSTPPNVTKYSFLNPVQGFCTSTCSHIVRCSYSNSLQAMCASTPSNVTKYSCLNLVQAFCTSTQPNIRRYSTSNSVQDMCTSTPSNVTKYSCSNLVQAFCTSTHPTIKKRSSSNSVQVLYISSPSNIYKDSCLSPVQAFCTSTHPTIKKRSSSNSVQVLYISSPSNIYKESCLSPVQVFCTSTPNVPKRTPVLLATASILVVSQNGDRFPARALLDQGSEVSFITESLAEKLELTCRFSAVPIIGVGAQRSNIAHRATTFQLISRIDESFKCHVDALMLPELTTCLPAARIVHTQWSHLEGLHLADPDFAKPDKIDIILGAHVYSQIIREGLRRGDVGAPIAQQTCLGWVLSGAINVDVDSECVREPSVN
ncbi:uncharacterized protein LOC143264583 [Megachile rotundata]|uniref:uncharacterized protein LOC143264583 n=1 Tax=Megachile rotundata TaxID=143995 RepID=UPI003FD0BE75